MNGQLGILADKIKSHAQKELLTELPIGGACVFKIGRTHAPIPTLYRPMICLIAQGSKNCHIGEETFSYSTGDVFINFLPMPVETEVISASDDEPLLSVAMHINLVKLADMILKIERVQSDLGSKQVASVSNIVTGPAPDKLIELFSKLLDVANDPMDAEILGEAVSNEIYYRLLTSHYGEQLRILLNQYGQIQPISKAVTYIHDNLHRTFQVSDLAEMVNMSKTTFFNSFKKVMHVAPNQYIKSTRLRKAQLLLTKGIQANEASYHVGYNSFSQFSREYKRLFGYSPSQTAAHIGASHPIPMPQSLVMTNHDFSMKSSWASI
jgi:AraC-like DNA-binding protein